MEAFAPDRARTGLAHRAGPHAATPVRARRRRSPVRLAVALAMSVLTACSASPPVEGTGPQVDLAFEKYTLANGLEVILRDDDRVTVAAVDLQYYVGPDDEEPGRTGFAHLFEHMMFQGSANVGPEEHFSRLQGVGASNVNAYTSFDQTTYLEEVPSGALELALWLESDRMGFLLERLDQAQLSTQQQVVRAERRQVVESVPYGLSNETMFQRLFPEGHPYHAGIIGSHEDVQAARLDDVREFFTRYYVPNNASLAIVGNLDIPATKAMVEKYFGPIPRGADVPERQIAPPQPAPQRVTVTDQVELPAVTMAWVTPPAYAPGDAEASVTASVLGGDKTSRLHEALVLRSGIAQQVSASQQSLRHGSVFTISATARPGRTTEELEAAIVRELDALAADGPTEAELAAVRTSLRSDTVFGLEQPDEVASRFNEYNAYFDDPGYLDRDLQRYTDVDAEGVRRFITDMLPRDEQLVVLTEPGEKVLPPDPPVPAPDAAPTAPQLSPVSGQEWRSTPPALAAGAPVTLPEAERFELETGLPVYHVESDGLPLAVAALVSRRGRAADPAELPGLVEFTANMMDEATATRDTLGIAREIKALGANLATSAGEDGIAVSVSALSSEIGKATAIMSEVARAPAFPEAELERVRGQSLVALQQQADDPAAIASTVTAREVYGPQHPYGRTTDEIATATNAFTRDDLVRFHQAAFTPANSALIVVGDLTAEQARALATEHFGSWTGTGTDPGPPPAPVPTAERAFVVDRPGSAQTALTLAQPGIGVADPDHTNLLVMNAVLGGSATSRINLNLRERQGFTYGASSALDSHRGVGLITLQADVNTESTGASVRELLNEVNAIRDAPVRDEELQLAKDFISRSLPADFITGRGVANAIGELYLTDRPGDYFQNLPAALAEVGVDDVQAAAQKYLKPEEMKVVAVGDRAQIEPQLEELSLGQLGYRGPDGAPVGG